MKRINIKVLLMSLIAIFAFASCSSDEEPGNNSPYNRLFRPTSVSVSENATDAMVSFSATPNTDYYIVELSTDSLYDAMPMGSGTVYGEDKSILKSPFQITNLNSATKYYVRVKSMNNDGRESKWAYPENFSFKTKPEQIMTGFTYLSTTATLTWTPNSTLTAIQVVNKATGAIEQTIDISSNTTALTNGTYDLTGLSPETEYTVNLLNGTTIRGYANFTTYAAAPAADHTIYLAAGDSISQHVVDSIATLSGSSVTFVLPQGETYSTPYTLMLPDGWSYNFYGLPGNNQPTLSIKQIDIAGNHSYINFNNVDIEKNPSGTTYLFNQTDACTVGTISFDGCTMSGIERSLVRLQGSATKVIDNLLIDNCLASDFGSGGYYFIHVDANSGSGVIKNISITESTFYNFNSSAQGFIQSKKTQMDKLEIKDCTFDKIIGDSGRYFIEFGQTSSGATNGISVVNCVFGSIATTSAKGGRYDDSNLTLTNDYATSDWNAGITSNIIAFTSYSGSRTDLFVDPDNGNFHYKDNTFAGRNSCGDPRWR